jgi:hypothetical protein
MTFGKINCKMQGMTSFGGFSIDFLRGKLIFWRVK